MKTSQSLQLSNEWNCKGLERTPFRSHRYVSCFRWACIYYFQDEL